MLCKITTDCNFINPDRKSLQIWYLTYKSDLLGLTINGKIFHYRRNCQENRNKTCNTNCSSFLDFTPEDTHLLYRFLIVNTYLSSNRDLGG